MSCDEQLVLVVHDCHILAGNPPITSSSVGYHIVIVKASSACRHSNGNALLSQRVLCIRPFTNHILPPITLQVRIITNSSQSAASQTTFEPVLLHSTTKPRAPLPYNPLHPLLAGWVCDWKRAGLFRVSTVRVGVLLSTTSGRHRFVDRRVSSSLLLAMERMNEAGGVLGMMVQPVLGNPDSDTAARNTQTATELIGENG